jgi:hypothetical protein
VGKGYKYFPELSTHALLYVSFAKIRLLSVALSSVSKLSLEFYLFAKFLMDFTDI